ncbi:putative aldo-keto reductase [Tricladium varicosporioides]|nr:putative aldo-keto reductase [Hymenoscyphus varicosporioides]
MASKLKFTDLLVLPNSSVKIPRIGFGVYLSEPGKCVASCQAALRAGYRHIDTAEYYANEKEVGEAVRKSGLKRSDVFITTKILYPGGSVEKNYERMLDSILKINGDSNANSYVDLFLIHTGNMSSVDRGQIWTAMERLLEEGRIKAIGVSNWGIGKIEELKSFAKIYPPHVNQIELHPFCQQREVVEFCQKNGIVIEAYCPLIRNQKANDPILKEIAEAHKKKTTQILVRYCLQKGWVPLPKSDTPSRIIENTDVYDFELSEKEMATLDGLDQGRKGAIVEAVVNTL